jgi:hypothetical protein
MTNAQAQAYAIIALKNLLEAGHVKKASDLTISQVLNALDSEMYYLFDRLSEEDAEYKAERILSE